MTIRNIDPVPIQLDKPRLLRHTMGAAKLIHQRTGRNILQAENPLDPLTPETLITVLHALLRHEDKTLTEEDLADMIDVSKTQEYTNLISKAFFGQTVDELLAAAKAKAAEPAEERPTEAAPQ